MPCQLSIGSAGLRAAVRPLAAIVALATLGTSAPAAAQARTGSTSPSAADSALIRRILVAEDRRDTAAAALSEGLASADPRIRLLARRARGRIADPKFALRDSLPPLAAPPSYPDPAWRLRYRALATKPVDCARLSLALADSAWPVRLRAADLATSECAANANLVATLSSWATKVPTSAARRPGQAGWQAASHGLMALARLSPGDAKALLPSHAASPVPWVRVAAARAAGTLADTATLRRLAVDRDDNVKEAAIDALSRVAGHSADDVYARTLGAAGYQAIRAAANALKGTPNRDVALPAARAALARLAKDDCETCKDARTAVGDVLRGLGDATPDDARPRPAAPAPLGRDAVALALGREYRLRVTLADSSGGGSFIVRVRGDAAPIMAARVLDLVRAGWYNGRAWYRVEPDFVIQGGGPGANEYVGHPRFMRDELSALPQGRGTVGMSTRGHDTGDAQWFINLRDNLRLTRDYTTWGEVVDGIDVVDGILEGDVIARIEVLPAKPHD